MTAWSDEELAHIGDAEEIKVAPVRPDGALEAPRIIWVVRLGGEVYVRSVNGPAGGWFRELQARREGHLWAGGVDAGVVSVDADHELDDQIDEEYRSKYGRSSTAVDSITSPEARSTTIRLLPS